MAHSSPYTVALDPEQARQLATTGAAMLLLDVPAGTLLGIDQQVFVVGPKFKGVKMVPPGMHFLSYQASGKEGQVSPAVSTFLMLRPREVVVRRWDAAEEALKSLNDEDEVARYAEGVRRFDFDAGLAPYDLAACARWRDLSCFIDEQLLKKLLPVGGDISVMAEALDPELMQPRTEAERKLVQQLQEGYARHHVRKGTQASPMDTDTQGGTASSTSEAATTAAASSSVTGAAPAQEQQGCWGRCYYTHLPRRVTAPGAQGAALTALNLDKTATLEKVAADSGDPGGKALLGELQFAFIAFLFGQSLEGFMQWKALLGLMLGCERGPLKSHSGLYVAFLGVLQQQLAIGLPQQQARQHQQQPGGQRDEGGHSDEGDSGDDGGFGVQDGPCPLGLPFVEELLPDSFLRRQFGSFFEMLHESGNEVPPPLAQQAHKLEVLLRDRLGWDFRVQQLGGGGGADEGCEDDEDQPVVVELTNEEKRMAGLEL